jgi:hypothetical protein
MEFWSSIHGDPVFLTFVEEAAFSPSCVLDSFVEDRLAIASQVYVLRPIYF